MPTIALGEEVLRDAYDELGEGVREYVENATRLGLTERQAEVLTAVLADAAARRRAASKRDLAAC